MATAGERRAAELIAGADAAARAHSPGTNEWDARCRLAYQVGALQQQVRNLCAELAAFDAPEAPAGVECESVQVDGVWIDVHFTYTKGHRGGRDEPPEAEEVEIHDLFIGGQKVNKLLDGDQDSVIEEALLASLRAAGVVAAMDRAQELAEDAAS